MKRDWIHHGRRPAGLCGAGGRGWEEGLGGDLLVLISVVPWKGLGRRPAGLCGAGGRGWGGDLLASVMQVGGAGRRPVASVVQVGGAGEETCWSLQCRWEGLGRGWEETCWSRSLWFR